jgi:hypothetical protein
MILNNNNFKINQIFNLSDNNNDRILLKFLTNRGFGIRLKN